MTAAKLRLPRTLSVSLLAVAGVLPFVAMVLACAGGAGNPNAPQGNAVGERHQAYMEVVAHARTFPPGRYELNKFPQELRIEGLLTMHVSEHKAYALEFYSEPIDSNPIYIYVEPGVSDPDRAIREFVAENPVWHALRKLDEPGWYFAYDM